MRTKFAMPIKFSPEDYGKMIDEHGHLVPGGGGSGVDGVHVGYEDPDPSKGDNDDLYLQLFKPPLCLKPVEDNTYFQFNFPGYSTVPTLNFGVEFCLSEIRNVSEYICGYAKNQNRDIDGKTDAMFPGVYNRKCITYFFIGFYNNELYITSYDSNKGGPTINTHLTKEECLNTFHKIYFEQIENLPDTKQRRYKIFLDDEEIGTYLVYYDPSGSIDKLIFFGSYLRDYSNSNPDRIINSYSSVCIKQFTWIDRTYIPDIDENDTPAFRDQGSFQFIYPQNNKQLEFLDTTKTRFKKVWRKVNGIWVPTWY